MTPKPLPLGFEAPCVYIRAGLDRVVNVFSWLSGMGSPLAVALAISAICFVTEPPDYARGRPIDPLDALVFKSAHPFTPIPPEIMTGPHDEKIDLRMTVPVLSWLIGAPVLGVRVWCHLAAVVCFGLVYWWLKRWTRDPPLAALTALGMAGTYWGHHFFTDGEFGDGVAYAFMLCALAAPTWPLTFVAAFSANFTDERAAICAPLLWLCQYGAVRRGADRAVERRKAIAIAAAVPAWFLLREYLRLSMHFSFGTRAVFTWSILRDNLNDSFLGRFLGCFEASWALLLVAALCLLVARELRTLTFFVCATALGAIPAFLVTDFSRSLAYAFPAILFGALFLQGLSGRRFAAALVVVNLLALEPAKAVLRATRPPLGGTRLHPLRR